MGERSLFAAVKDWPQRMGDWLGDRGFLKAFAMDPPTAAAR
jgi:hypothetical protein